MMRHGDNHKRLQKPAGDLHSCLAKTKCTQKQKNLTFVSLSTGMVEHGRKKNEYRNIAIANISLNFAGGEQMR